MTIGTITANSATTIGITATGFVGVTAGGPLTVASGVSAGGAIQLTASEGAAPDTNNVTVNAGVTVTSTAGNITIQAGDNLTILGGVFANLATGVINLLSLDAIDVPSTGAAGITGTVFTIHGSLQANQINITGSAQDDNFDIKLSGIHSTNSPQIDGGSGDETRTAIIRSGRSFAVNPNKRPYFVPAVAPADGISNSIGDQVFLDDSAGHGRRRLHAQRRAGVSYRRRAGVHEVCEHRVAEADDGRGNNDVTAT